MMLCLDMLIYYLNEKEVKVPNLKMIQGEMTIQFFLNNCITKRTTPHLPVPTSKKVYVHDDYYQSVEVHVLYIFLL